MAFGRLVTKWRVFRAPLQGSLKNMKKTIVTAFILHNFIINNCGEDDDVPVEAMTQNGQAQNTAGNQLGYLETPVPNGASAQEYNLVSIPGQSTLRSRIREHIVLNQFTRPRHNIERNEFERKQAAHDYAADI